MPPSADRNFLFALIAYQNGYITMEQFFLAAQAWNKNPHADIADILVEQKFVEEVERFNIDGIVEDRLRRLGSLENSLSFMIENGSLPEGEPLPEAWQKKLEEVTKVNLESITAQSKKPGSSPSIHRYVFRRAIGEGGQGIVWEVDDTELGRRIALKKVHPKHANSPLHNGMLIEESRNTGRLDHAGIVPIYDLGQDDQGNPFFTMQLVRGEKLADRVRAIRYESIGRDEFLAQVRPLLRHLIAACNTLQYAYDKFKVIHRDLKPENIMVNRYGETVVMDWGMGKAVEDASQLDDASSMLFVPVSGSGSGTERTQVGSVKGTLGYLSPEQAQAMNNNLDNRTDIYGLGATLYRILTGTVPHSGHNLQETLSRAKLNQFITPRQRNSKIPKELEAICLKAMATSPEDRYQKATDMGQDLENWITGDPISVLPDTALKKAERWLRRHARGVIASMLLLTLTSAALLWSVVWVLQQKSEVVNLNQSLRNEQKKTKESREVSSRILDEIVGYIFDDELTQIDNSYPVRTRTLKLAIDKLNHPETGYVNVYPEDWSLKLDLLRLLVRLATQEKDRDPQDAQLHWTQAQELIESAKTASLNDLDRENWLHAETDKQMYYSAFLAEVQNDFKQAFAAIERAGEIADLITESNGDNDSMKLIRARVLLQKSTLHLEQRNFEKSLSNTLLATELLEPMLGVPMKAESLESQNLQKLSENVFTVLFYIMAAHLESESLLGLDRLQELEKKLLEELRICKNACQIPMAKIDASRFAVNSLSILLSLASKKGDALLAEQYYQDAMEWVESGSLSVESNDVLLPLEIARAKSLAQSNPQLAQNSLDKAQDYLLSLQPDPINQPIGSLRSYLSRELDFLDAKLAIATADSKLEEVDRIKLEISEKKRQREDLLNNLPR